MKGLHGGACIASTTALGARVLPGGAGRKVPAAVDQDLHKCAVFVGLGKSFGARGLRFFAAGMGLHRGPGPSMKSGALPYVEAFRMRWRRTVTRLHAFRCGACRALRRGAGP